MPLPGGSGTSRNAQRCPECGNPIDDYSHARGCPNTIDINRLDPFGERFAPEDHAFFRALEAKLDKLSESARTRRKSKLARAIRASPGGYLPSYQSVEWVCLVERVDPWTAADMILEAVAAGDVRYRRTAAVN